MYLLHSKNKHTYMYMYNILIKLLKKKINYITLKTQTTLILYYRHDGPFNFNLKIQSKYSKSTDIKRISNQTISYKGSIILDFPLDSHFKEFLTLNLVISMEIFES